MELTQEKIATIARLAHLKLTPEKYEAVCKDLSHILGWIDTLNELDVENVEPTLSVFVQDAPRREDVVSDGDKVDAVLANAPGSPMLNMFEVPKVVE